MFERIYTIYKRHFIKLEFIISILITILLFFIIKYFWSPEDVRNWISQNKRDIYPLISTISGALLGFIITGVSIILAFSESEELKLLKQSKQYKTIFEIYFSTIKFLAITTIIPIVGIVINNKWMILLFYLFLWSLIISSLRIWRCLWILENIVEIIQGRNTK
jgi:hypothetical protein